MAKVTAGPLAGMISGKVGNVVFSRGKYGPYIRIRTIPTLVQNDYTNGVRGRLGTLAGLWSVLDPELKFAWRTYAATHPIVDRLGEERVLQPSAVYIALNARILQAGGTRIDLPPIASAPAGVTPVEVIAISAPATFEVVWQEELLSAEQCIAIWVAIYELPGRQYYRNLLKLVYVGPPGNATYHDCPTEVADRYGVLIDGYTVKCELEVWDNTTGLVSSRSATGTVVTS